MEDWNHAQYLKFADERTQPAVDLAARIPLENPRRIVDIGCGPGNSTGVLARRFPGAEILGVDSSPDMIAAAQKSCPNQRFLLCDVQKDLPALGGGFDVVFSNACIQWVPDHPTLLQNLMNLLAPGGVLAVQTPMNYEEPIHRIICEVTKSEKWAAKLPVQRIFYNLTPGEYYDLLSELSPRFELWMTTYYHKMKSHADILEWYRSTGLRPYLSALAPADRPAFEQDVFTKVEAAYPKQKNGSVIFRFPRFFFVAVR